MSKEYVEYLLKNYRGIKRDILAFIDENMPGRLRYAGLHPMAGKEIGGFANAQAAMLRGAGFIIVLPEQADERAAELVRELSRYVGAGRIVTNEGGEHDAIIAYTSDLMHIAANALCAEYPKNMTMAHTAGAFRDCTRIARLDAELWTELLLGNAENILEPLRAYIGSLKRFEAALAGGDEAALRELLRTGTENKEKMLRL